MKKTYKALLCGAAAVAAVGIAYAMDERFFEKAKDKLTVFKCRANSKIMEQALPLTDAMFPGPKVVSGADSAKKIPEVLKELNVNKVMIVTGPTVGRTIVPPIAENLERHGIGYTIYDQVEANPSVKTVEAIRAQYLENGCDGFLAIGGGSPMDAAKAAAARVAKPNTPIGKMAGLMKVMIKVAPIVAVPTTSGTGAEATRSCIIASQTLGVKATLSSQAAKADFVYLDPQITKSLPPYVTATTGMDAIAHACEALCCTKSNLFTEMICGKSLELSWANLLTAYKEPDNLEARANMSMAAYLGLTGESYGNCGHSMAHAIGARFHVPHGHCCAWTAPVALYFTRKECDHEIRLIARCFGMDDRSETVAADVANAMKKLVWEMNIATPAERGISREEFVSDATVEKVMLDPIWHFCPTEFNEDTARQLLGEVYDQKLY